MPLSLSSYLSLSFSHLKILKNNYQSHNHLHCPQQSYSHPQPIATSSAHSKPIATSTTHHNFYLKKKKKLTTTVNSSQQPPQTAINPATHCSHNQIQLKPKHIRYNLAKPTTTKINRHHHWCCRHNQTYKTHNYNQNQPLPLLSQPKSTKPSPKINHHP